MALAGASQATILIDDYTSGSGSDTIGGNSTNFVFQNGTMLGGDRLLWHTISSNPLNLTHSATVINGILSVAGKTQVDSMTQVAYGYQPSSTGGFTFQDMNSDFSAETAFKVTCLSNDLTGTMTVYVRSAAVNGGSFLSSTMNLVPGMNSTTHTYDFAFSNFAGMNWADIDQVVLEINNDASGDTVIDTFEAVPEPTTMVALAAGAIALAARRRRIR